MLTSLICVLTPGLSCLCVYKKIWLKDIKEVAAFSDYKGMLGDFDSGVEYFLNLFLSVNESPDKVRGYAKAGAGGCALERGKDGWVEADVCLCLMSCR